MGKDPFAPPIYHLATKLRSDGAASALCYRRPRKIPKTERWCLRPDAVTCKRCRKILDA